VDQSGTGPGGGPNSRLQEPSCGPRTEGTSRQPDSRGSPYSGLAPSAAQGSFRVDPAPGGLLTDQSRTAGGNAGGVQCRRWVSEDRAGVESLMAFGDVTTPIDLMIWLLRLRWVTVAGQTLGILVGNWLIPGELSLVPLFSLVVVGAVSNIFLAKRLRDPAPVPETLPGLLLAMDSVLLTGLLYLSGGPSNPFTAIYLVQVTLAAVVMRGFWAWGLSILSTLGFILLFFFNIHVHALMQMSHEAGVFSLHLLGMLAAFSITAALIAAFVGRVSMTLRNREEEVLALRDRSARQARLASLATLTAGVAHELGTPLGTIAVAAGELHRTAQALGPAGSALALDAVLIRQEVRRCREILDQMADPSGSTYGEDLQPMIWSTLQVGLPKEATHRLRCTFPDQPGGLVPIKGLLRTLRALVVNALEASPDNSQIDLRAWKEGGQWIIRVEDKGRGMSPDVLARAGEPFFTTKGTGEGMGLGLFLARTFAEQLGGGLSLMSTQGEGTSVELRWPEILNA
jgi:two-component system, sensor histidine kinase RegB